MDRRPPPDEVPEPSRRVTIHDVADSLGVSPATVSLALNGKGTISPSTRERVAAEATRLGYTANPLARGLRAGRSGVLGLSVRSLDAYGSYRPAGVDHFTRMAGAAAFTALDRGFSLMLVPHRGNGKERDVPSWLDGYVLEDPRSNDPVVDYLLAAGVTVVTIGWDPARKARTAWVSTSVREETRRGLDLLQNRGARSIAFVSGTERNSWNAEAERAYRAWCRDNRAPVRLLHVPEAVGEEGGAGAAAELLNTPVRPDAVFCQTGRHAAGVADAAIGMGFVVPEDLMIMAGSDAEQTRHFHPGITSIDLRPEELGREAVELLADLITGMTSRRTCSIEGRLIERASTRRSKRRPAAGPSAPPPALLPPEIDHTPWSLRALK